MVIFKRLWFKLCQKYSWEGTKYDIGYRLLLTIRKKSLLKDNAILPFENLIVQEYDDNTEQYMHTIIRSKSKIQ